MNYSYGDALTLLKKSFVGSECDIWVDEVCKSFSQQTLTMLDIGVGTGESVNKKLLLLEARGYKVQLTGLDPYQADAKLAQSMLPDADLYGMRFEEFTSTKMYDIVNASHSLYYLENLGKSLQKMIKLVGKSGLLILTLWSESCVLYWLHKEVFGDKTNVVTAELVNSLLIGNKELGGIKLISVDSWVDLAKWKNSPEMLRAALLVISRRSNEFHFPESTRLKLLESLSQRPSLDIRKNIVILASNDEYSNHLSYH